MSHIVILGTLDTKLDEVLFMKARVESKGHGATVVDVGPLGPSLADPDVSNRRVARLGGVELQDLLRERERDRIMRVMGNGAARCLLDLYKKGKADGVIAIGGNQGTAMASMAMQALPIGFPKYIISTVASGNIRPYVGYKDIGITFSVADLVGGPNPVTRSVLANGVGAILGMVEHGERISFKRAGQVIGVSALGNTEAAASRAVQLLKERGCQVMAFHASGAGGSAMEELIEEGLITAVLDLTPHEISEEVVGAGAYVPVRPGRLTAAGRLGIPQVLSLGALEYVCFGSRESIPFRLRRRKIYMHNPYNANLKLSLPEMEEVGRVMADRLNQARGPVVVMVPLKGWSIYGSEGGPFHHPRANRVLLRSLREHLQTRILVRELDMNINEGPFADQCVDQLINCMEEKTT